MSLNPLLEAFRGSPAFGEVADALGRDETVTAVEQVRAPLIAALAERDPGPWLVVVPGSREAERLAAELRAWSPSSVLYPAWETLPHEKLSPRAETVSRRLEALHALNAEEPPGIVVAPVRAVIQHMVPGTEGLEPVAVHRGEAVALDDLADRLSTYGYRRTDMVTSRGEFAVRGFLLDVFPPTDDHPVRVELFGDEVDSLRTFAVASQRSLGTVDELVAFPCRELLLTDDVRGRAIVALEKHPHLASELHRLADGIAFEGMESLLEVLFEELPVLRDLMPSGTRVLVVEPKRTADRAAEMAKEVDELRAAGWAAAAEGAMSPSEGTYATIDRALGTRRAALSPFREGGVELVAHVWEHGREDVPGIAADLKRMLGEGYRVVVCAESQGSADRIREILAGQELFLPQHDGGPLAPARGAVAVAQIDQGFASEALALAVVGEGDLFGKRRPHREPRTQRRRVSTIELEPGDLAVHVFHGVGRYLGMETREIGDGRADYLVLEYAEGDRLYVPADQLDVVNRYIGGEDPKLHRLGGSDWNRQKARVRKAVKDIAGELVKLYSARSQQPGFSFSMDQPWQRELEDAFPYTETRDQLAAIDDVKADMERGSPMDRLICGDVGYGKTEIALRAAFKAVLDGKQVAVLVPTTLLAQQHFATFTERFSPFPVRVAVLSRFVSTAEQKRAIEEIAAGKIDVVIGTHRLLQKDVRFEDLGLLIVDEEQRFGVTHKEALKKLKTSVDVLTLTATPIPRTLEMSLSGIRDLSVVDTPPEDRHPVLTFVGPFDEASMGAAVRREMLREGQVFYVHDRVQGIEAIAGRVRTLVPEARVGVAHGQLNERQLERVMLDFWDRSYDVLVTTTIIESGLDIPTANTLIVDRADRLGLAQLYQLRGRVGRSRERAYAYFFFPPERSLSEQSHARLAAISQFTDLGSGMQIALRDLEIRGAGNMLGAEQHGHIATVGFELYVRLLAEAVEEAKGNAAEMRPEVKIDLPVDAHLPESWIAKEPLRLEAYRRIAEAPTLQALDDARAELIDRYGALPPQAETLLTVAALRIEVGPLGVRTVVYANRQVRLEPFVLTESQQVRVRYKHPGSIVKLPTYTVVLPVPRDVQDVAAWLLDACRDILSP